VHEVSLVAGLVDAVAARAGGRHVASIRVRHATTIPADVLRQAFAMLTAEGPLAGAVLVAEPFDVPLTCGCGFTGAATHDDLVGGSLAACPACGELVAVPRTAELELVEVRLAPRPGPGRPS
jgi:Zn finger protein HypA/HybF involved in hydrogenase expression